MVQRRRGCLVAGQVAVNREEHGLFHFLFLSSSNLSFSFQFLLLFSSSFRLQIWGCTGSGDLWVAEKRMVGVCCCGVRP
jgi:hypothetical protein